MTTDKLAAVVSYAEDLLAHCSGNGKCHIEVLVYHLKTLMNEVELFQADVASLRKKVCPACRDGVPLACDWIHRHTDGTLTDCEAMP